MPLHQVGILHQAAIITYWLGIMPQFHRSYLTTWLPCASLPAGPSCPSPGEVSLKFRSPAAAKPTRRCSARRPAPTTAPWSTTQTCTSEGSGATFNCVGGVKHVSTVYHLQFWRFSSWSSSYILCYNTHFFICLYEQCILFQSLSKETFCRLPTIYIIILTVWTMCNILCP